MNKILFFVFFCSSILSLNSQDTYIVYLKSKELREENLKLSKAAIERRKRYGIAIDARDYQIEPDRAQKIDEIAPIQYKSKWLNAISVKATTTQIDKIKKLSFVESVDVLKKMTATKSSLSKFETQFSKEEYGKAYAQINMHQGDLLHDAGYLGQGMKIAILDAGFSDVKNIKSFQHLIDDERLIPVKNIVDNSNSLFTADNHGTFVLGCMASFVKDTIVATAPKATYYLFITEDVRSETRVEEFNWAIAAEMADSIGVDIINSSLGYNEFDDPSQNYTKAQMDGNTTIVSKAAAIACEKGIIVVNSAGNMGNKTWRMITAPSDAEKVITVGAVDIDKNIADFSSRGFSANNTVKPNVMAVGRGTTMYYNDGNYHLGSGTSFSSPVMAGLVACFWQKNKTLKPDEIRDLIYTSSSHFITPNEDMGFGIPEFKRIIDINYISVNNREISIFPNPTQKSVVVEVNAVNAIDNSEISVYNFNKEIMKNKISLKKGKNQLFVDIDGLSRGVYFIKVKMDNYHLESRFEKL